MDWRLTVNLRPRNLLLAIAAPLALSACPTTEEEDPAEHACEHFAEVGLELDAAADRADDSSAVLAIGHTPNTVALTSGEAGWVSIEVTEEEQALLLYIDTANVVNGLFHNDEVADELPAAGGANTNCPDDLPEHFDLDLHEGVWHVQLGPAAVDSVWISLLEAAGHGHEDDE